MIEFLYIKLYENANISSILEQEKYILLHKTLYNSLIECSSIGDMFSCDIIIG